MSQYRPAKGMRDFLPAQMRKRLWVMQQLQTKFESFGFEPMQTPALERLEMLTGKTGQEGEHQMFKIQARGAKAAAGVADLGLRFDLTVPLARVVAAHGELRLPFRRWQIAPVWRAENPQRGRYREFYQCDCDIVGSAHPAADAECIALLYHTLADFAICGFRIRVNDRRILRAMAQWAGATPEMEAKVITTIDKLDKIGRDAVAAELVRLGLEHSRVEAVFDGDTSALEFSEEGAEGASYLLNGVLPLLPALGVPAHRVVFDPTLARGLDYYTGIIFEIDVPIKGTGVITIAGGGRYDNMIGKLEDTSTPCVGFSLGLDRLLLALEDQNLLPSEAPAADILVMIDEHTRAYGQWVASKLRSHGLNVVVSLEATPLDKQVHDAHVRGIPFTAYIGTNTREGQVHVSNLRRKVKAWLEPTEVFDWMQQSWRQT